MDHSCPVCNRLIDKNKLSRAIVSAMATDCPHCMHRIHLNIHRAEAFIVLLNFSLIVILAAFAWWLQSRDLVLAMLAAIMVGALVLPLLEKIWLRHWPRYISPADGATSQEDGGTKV